MVLKVPNDAANQQLMFGVESVAGEPVVPVARLNGTVDFPVGPAPLSDYEDVTGTYLRDSAPARGTRQLAGNYQGPASYERLPSLVRAAWVAGGDPAVTAAPAYTYEQSPALTTDDVDALTLYFNHAGNGFMAAGARFNELNIAGDIDNADGFWTVSGQMLASSVDQLPGSFEGVATAGTDDTLTMTGAGWTVDEYAGAFVFLDYGTGTGPVRQIVSNTAEELTVSADWETAPQAGDVFRIAGQFPAGIPVLSEEKIQNGGTRLFIDDASGTIGTTQILKRFISFNVTTRLNLDPKRFMENEDGEYSGLFGRGRLQIDGQIRLEFDRYDEIAAAKSLREMAIRIEKLGTELEPGVRKMARIDVHRAVWNEPTRDQRNNNLTQTLAFRAYEAFPPIELITRNGLSVLPAA